MPSAEQLTRQLRDKNAEPGSVASICKQILHKSINVYLPKPAHFVLELLCDRINDSGKFRRWKCCAEIWALLAETWSALGSSDADIEFRTRTLRRLKLVQVLTSVFDHVAKSSDCELMAQCLNTAILLSQDTYIQVEEYAAVGLVTLFLTMFPQNSSGPLERDISTWGKFVLHLFSLPRLALAYKPAKKSTARVFEFLIPAALRVATNENVGDSLKSQVLELLDMLLFDLHVTYSAPNFDMTIAKSGELEVQHLFSLVMARLAATDIQACEDTFSSISKHHPTLSEPLLRIMAKINRVLSPSFFQALYDTEIAKNNVNWLLVSLLFRLDTVLVSLTWESVIRRCNSRDLAVLVDLIQHVAAGFVKARDFGTFVCLVYPAAVTILTAYASDEAFQLLAPLVDELSANQISKILADPKSSPSSRFLIVSGLLLCSLTKQSACHGLLLSLKLTAREDFLVLCMYGELRTDAITKNDDIISMRAMEIQLIGFDAQVIGHAIKSMHTTKLLHFLRRWIVLMNEVPEMLPQLHARVFSEVPRHDIVSFFSDFHVVVFELRNVLHSLLKYLKEHPWDGTYELFKLMPPVVFHKYFTGFFDSIVENVIADPESPTAKDALYHVLSEPRLTSGLEKDSALMRRFIGACVSVDSPYAYSIFELVWKEHLRQFRNSSSKGYAENILSELLTGLGLPSLPDWTMALVVLRNPPRQYANEVKELTRKFVAVTMKELSDSNLDTMILSLAEIPALGAQVGTNSIFKEMGTRCISDTSKAKMFALVCSVKDGDIKSALFVLSLFVALSQQQVAIDLSVLRSYLSRLDKEILADALVYVNSSLRKAPGSFIGPLIDATAAIFPLLRKDCDRAPRLFARAVSGASSVAIIPQHYSLISVLADMATTHVWIFSQYATEVLLAFCGKIGKLSTNTVDNSIFEATIQFLSFLVLYHRFRFSSRYHLVVAVVNRLMEPLTSTSKMENKKEGAQKFSRLLSNLCEPRLEKMKDLLTSQATLYKKALRKHAHMFLVQYVYLQLNHRFSAEVTEALQPGLNAVFSLVSRAELHLVGEVLDSDARVYFRTLYGNFQETGKWRP